MTKELPKAGQELTLKNAVEEPRTWVVKQVQFRESGELYKVVLVTKEGRFDVMSVDANGWQFLVSIS